MLDLSEIRDRIVTQTGYTVEYVRAKEPDLQEITTLPIIFIGYSSIDSKFPSSPVEMNLLSMHGEDLVQTIETQIVCEMKNLKPIWLSLQKALTGWNPIPNEEFRSGITFSQGGVIGIANGLLWWMDRWRIGFPTIHVSF